MMPLTRRCFVGLLSCAFLITGTTVFASSNKVVPNPNSREYTRYVKYPKVNYGKPPASEIIKRGEYLAKVGDCASCHTALAPGSKTFAGGLGMKTPFGTFYTPNITPDKATGIGSWSDADFLKALHEGVAPHGKHLFPVFPYVYFTKIHKQDALALKAYLFAIPPVYAPKRKNDVPFPFSWRFLQVGWRVLFFDFDHGYYKPNPNKSKEWNRGAYLVQGLGHCGMCHTPLNPLGAAKNKYFLTGGFVAGFYAPDITGKALKDKSIDDIVAVFKKEKMLSGGKVEGPMMEVDHNSLRYLKDSDLRAIAVYLKTVKSATPPTEKVVAAGSGTAEGKAIYESKCSVCHSTGAAGAPKLGNATDWDPRIKLGMKTLYKNAINGIGSMPPKGTCMSCTDKQIEDVVDYMVAEAKNGKANAKPKGKAPEPASLARGKKVYEEHCAMCHAKGVNGAPKVGDQEAWKHIISLGMETLFTNTINGYRTMPARGGCITCTDGDLIAATKYMVEESKTKGDYRLW